MGIPVYIFNGFLESGKTQFIKDTLLDPGFTENEKTLIVACEEGNTLYSSADRVEGRFQRCKAQKGCHERKA